MPLVISCEHLLTPLQYKEKIITKTEYKEKYVTAAPVIEYKTITKCEQKPETTGWDDKKGWGDH